ncbi:MAG TPA: class I SAM-dependent methyltransferase [Ignavibacteriaceae bacterium]|nr:class I SAM-dependent methyltransferase [Ignavibacteriaceae bacterium]
MSSPLCLICKGSLSKEVISNGYIYYKCAGCFTSQIFPQPSQRELDDYYNKFHLNESEGGSYDWIEERMQSDFGAKINLLTKYKDGRDNSLLDVGCGKGYFVSKCKSSGFKAKGIDVSVSGIEFAKNKLGVDAERITVEEFSNQPANKENFNFATLLATIEHLPDPFAVLNSVNKCLKPGGILLLDTGLGNDKFERYLTGHSQWYDALQHLFVYSEEGLKILLEKSGFIILSIDRNFERNTLRKIIRLIRHSFICFASFIFIRPVLGKKAFESMKMESKWPI